MDLWVSASGGADSSAVIALVALGVAWVVGEYGKHAAERLGAGAVGGGRSPGGHC